MRRTIAISAILLTALLITAAVWQPWFWLAFALWGPALSLGTFDFFQHADNVRRNYLFWGSVNELLKKKRHIPQEVVRRLTWGGRPFSRFQQSNVYQHAAGAPGLLNFVDRMRELADRKPVAIKLRLAQHGDFDPLCRLMRASGMKNIRQPERSHLEWLTDTARITSVDASRRSPHAIECRESA